MGKIRLKNNASNRSNDSEKEDCMAYFEMFKVLLEMYVFAIRYYSPFLDIGTVKVISTMYGITTWVGIFAPAVLFVFTYRYFLED